MCQIGLLQRLRALGVREPRKLLLVVVDRARDIQPRAWRRGCLGLGGRGAGVVRWQGIAATKEKGAAAASLLLAGLNVDFVGCHGAMRADLPGC